jgi:hypothetical protein
MMKFFIKFLYFNKYNKFFNLLFLLIIIIFSFYLSILKGQYHYDAHHHGVYFSNAKDLFEGKIPYKNIYIQHGILTTIFHSFAYLIFGNVLSITYVTAAAYSLGLLIVFLISNNIIRNNFISLLVCLTLFFFHPYIIFPWSNYIAFPFLMSGILFLIKNSKNFLNYFFSGIFFSLTILIREAFVIPILMIVIVYLFLHFFFLKIKSNNLLIISLYLIIGLALPISFFFIYILYFNLFSYWYDHSIILHKIYVSEHFTHVKYYFGIPNFFFVIFNGIKFLDFKWILFLIYSFFNFFFLLIFFFNNKLLNFIDKKTLFKLVFISFCSFFLILTALHLPDIWRLSTGSIIGIIVIYFFLRKIFNFIFIILVFTLTLLFLFKSESLYKFSNIEHSNFKEFIDKKKQNRIYVNNGIFKGQYWKKDIVIYYDDVKNSLESINKLSCNIKYYKNNTLDVFVTLLTSYLQYQVSPHYTKDAFNEINRNRFDINKKIQEAKDIIIYEIISESNLIYFLPPNGFIVYRKFKVPKEFMFHNSEIPILLILIPSLCIN